MALREKGDSKRRDPLCWSGSATTAVKNTRPDLAVPKYACSKQLTYFFLDLYRYLQKFVSYLPLNQLLCISPVTLLVSSAFPYLIYWEG